MDRPRVFLSAVSEELRSARQKVAATVRTLGFDPVSQDDFPTGYGELRGWLREQIDGCEGLIQIVGQGYGAEPPEINADYGRVSYTQFEFLYARLKGKKTWIIVAGDAVRRDKAAEQLDVPRGAAHADAPGYQAERRQLQQAYIERLRKDNHLRHHAADDTALENIVLKLRDELAVLREKWEQWLRQDAQFKQETGAQLAAVVEATRLTTEKIRAHLLETIEQTYRRELAEADKPSDWQQRQRLRESAQAAHAARLAKVDELAASFADIEGRGSASSVFQEMSRVLAEQGVDQAIAYVASRRAGILQAVRARAAAARERNRADLQPLLQAAGLCESGGRVDEARALFRDVLGTEPEWPAALHECFWFLSRQGDTARVRATLDAAKREYDEAHLLALRLTASDSSNTEWQRDLSVSISALGQVAAAQGQLDEAARAYGEALAITQRLAQTESDNTRWQRALSVSYDNLGNLELARGQLADATRAYRQGLAIHKKLASAEPGNSARHRDLWVAYSRLGDVSLAQRQPAYAEQLHSLGLFIATYMRKLDPENTEWQRNWSISSERLGDAAMANGKLAHAARAYSDSHAIRTKLAECDSGNKEWQRDLSVSYTALGEVAAAQGQLDEAARNYGDALVIAESLTASDVNNTQWRRDVYVLHWRLARLAERQIRPEEARGHWRQAFALLIAIKKLGAQLSDEDEHAIEMLRKKIGPGAS